MSVALNVDIFDVDGRVLVRHTFYGETEDEAREWKEHHLAACSYFRQADSEERTGEFVEEIPDEDVPDESDYEQEEEAEEGE